MKTCTVTEVEFRTLTQVQIDVKLAAAGFDVGGEPRTAFLVPFVSGLRGAAVIPSTISMRTLPNGDRVFELDDEPLPETVDPKVGARKHAAPV